MTRFASLLAVSCLGTGLALVAGRSLLAQAAAPTPDQPREQLEWLRRWSPDPARRREASLLLLARLPDDPPRRAALMAHQGWGGDPLAAVVLRHGASAAEALDRPAQARRLWQELLRRFPSQPLAADALYSLGRARPALRDRLLQRFPAHPAALAAALELGPAPAERLRGGLHLARWGARWPGAQERLRQLCSPAAAGGSGAAEGAAEGAAAAAVPAPARAAAPALRLDPRQRALLAGGLAQLGDGQAALACLGSPGSAARAKARSALSADHRLALARALVRSEGQDRAEALALLVATARTAAPTPRTAVPTSGAAGSDPTTAEEAVRLLAQQEGEGVAQALQALPAAWRDTAPVAAWRARALSGADGGQGAAAEAVLRRWPEDPASWELQWDLVRRRLLEGRWRESAQLLDRLPAAGLPAPLAARSLFWRGMVHERLGESRRARQLWRALRRQSPGGYYGWRASVRLGETSEREAALPRGRADTAALAAAERWQPLASGDAFLDQLWRLDQRTEAWELWRTARANRPSRSPDALLVEGRLRQGVGDDWLGLALLEQASLRLPPQRCALLPQLERSLHPPRFAAIFQEVAAREGLPRDLLLGVARQESRFTPQVRSGVGAVGLMQLMPATAAELAGGPLSDAALEDPAQNVALGGLYLRGLLQQWQGNPLLAVASYNAGPGAVEGWLSPPAFPSVSEAPELWVEAIPYPETRLYVKKVLGNSWSYRSPRLPAC